MGEKWSDEIRRHGEDISDDTRREILSAGAGAVSELIEILEDRELLRFTTKPAIAALELLAEIRAPEGIDRIFAVGRDGDGLVYSEVIDALARYGEVFLEFGLAAMNDPNIEVRGYAANILGALGVWDERVHAALCTLVAESGFWGCSGVEAYGDPRSPELLHGLIEGALDRGESDEDTLDEWIVALERLGGTPSERALRWRFPNGEHVASPMDEGVQGEALRQWFEEALPVVHASVRDADSSSDLVLYIARPMGRPAIVLHDTRARAAEWFRTIKPPSNRRLADRIEACAPGPLAVVKHWGGRADVHALRHDAPAKDARGDIVDVFEIDPARRFELVQRLGKARPFQRLSNAGRVRRFVFGTEEAPYGAVELWSSELRALSPAVTNADRMARELKKALRLFASPRRINTRPAILEHLHRGTAPLEGDRALMDAARELRVAAPWSVLPDATTVSVRIPLWDVYEGTLLLRDAGRAGFELDVRHSTLALDLEGRAHHTDFYLGPLSPSPIEVAMLVAITRGLAELARSGRWNRHVHCQLEVQTPMGPCAVQFDGLRVLPTPLRTRRFGKLVYPD